MDRLRRRRTAALSALALAVIIGLAGCAGGGASGGATRQSDAVPAQGLDAGGANEKANAGADLPEQGDPTAEPEVRVTERVVVYTGEIVVRVADVDAAATRASTITTTAGGFVGGDQRTSDDTRSEATLTLRVPADRFYAVVDELAGLGEPERRDIRTEDVTEAVVDLDARIATQRARVESGRRLLAQAKTLDDLIRLEREVATREADLASLEARKRRLSELSALSTITVVLLGPDAKTEPETGFLVGLAAGWQAFLFSLKILLTVLGAMLPWLIGFGVPIWALIWLVRRLRRRRKPAASAPVERTVLPQPGPAPAVPARPVPAARVPQPAPPAPGTAGSAPSGAATTASSAPSAAATTASSAASGPSAGPPPEASNKPASAQAPAPDENRPTDAAE